MPTPILEPVPEEMVGDRVVVRPYRADDAAALWAAVDESRAHLARWLQWVEDYRSPNDANALIARAQAQWLLRENLIVAICRRDNGRLVGGSGLHRIDWAVRCFEIGYWVRVDAEGKGYVTEAVQLLTRAAFDHLGANRVEIRMDPRNDRSRRIPERLGFVLEGTLRNCALDDQGLPAHRHIFALTPADFSRLDWAGSGLGGAP